MKLSKYEKTFERKARIAASEILEHVGKVEEIKVEGELVKIKSLRHLTFKKSPICVSCGVIGTHFCLERHRHGNTSRYHLNLYGKNANGEEVMMTKDHIIPRSKGGRDFLKNMQTMCDVCNEQKGNK